MSSKPEDELLKFFSTLQPHHIYRPSTLKLKLPQLFAIRYSPDFTRFCSSLALPFLR